MSGLKSLTDLIFEHSLRTNFILPAKVFKVEEDKKFKGVQLDEILVKVRSAESEEVSTSQFFLHAKRGSVSVGDYKWIILEQNQPYSGGNYPVFSSENKYPITASDYSGFLVSCENILKKMISNSNLNKCDVEFIDFLSHKSNEFAFVNKDFFEDLKSVLIFNKNYYLPSPNDLVVDMIFDLTIKMSIKDGIIKHAFISAFMASIYNGTLILLEGSVGTGKTTLARSFPYLVGGNCEIIAVRPAWTDTSDIFGYYDPLSKIFRPERFVETITDEKFQGNNLAMVVFDEMNLARIENYGADLLAQIEKVAEYRQNTQNNEVDEEPKLAVWSTEEFNATVRELAHLEKKENRSFDDQRRLDVISTILNKYPSKVQLPQGFVFVGTLNADETTFDISPKVIDRSFVVGFPNADLTEPELEKYIHTNGPIDLTHLRYMIKEKLSDSSFGLPEWSVFKEKMQCEFIFDNFECYGIPLSYRVFRDFKVCAVYANIINISDSEKTMIHLSFLFSRILPRIVFTKEDLDEDQYQKFENWLSYLSGIGSAHSSFKRIIQRLEKQMSNENFHQVRYWG